MRDASHEFRGYPRNQQLQLLAKDNGAIYYLHRWRMDREFSHLVRFRLDYKPRRRTRIPGMNQPPSGRYFLIFTMAHLITTKRHFYGHGHGPSPDIRIPAPREVAERYGKDWDFSALAFKIIHDDLYLHGRGRGVVTVLRIEEDRAESFYRERMAASFICEHSIPVANLLCLSSNTLPTLVKCGITKAEDREEVAEFLESGQKHDLIYSYPHCFVDYRIQVGGSSAARSVAIN